MIEFPCHPQEFPNAMLSPRLRKFPAHVHPADRLRSLRERTAGQKTKGKGAQARSPRNPTLPDRELFSPLFSSSLRTNSGEKPKDQKCKSGSSREEDFLRSSSTRFPGPKKEITQTNIISNHQSMCTLPVPKKTQKPRRRRIGSQNNFQANKRSKR